MVLFNNFTFDINIVSYVLLGGTTCYIIGSIVKNIWFSPSDTQSYVETLSTGIQSPVETSSVDTGVNTIRAMSDYTIQPSPTLHYFTPDQLRSMMDLTTEGSPVETSWADKGVQTINENFEGITLNLNHSPISLDPTSMDFWIPDSSSMAGKVNNLAWLYPDHPNYITWMLSQPAQIIVANPQLFDNFNLF